MGLLLDFHCSDYWADPQQQNKPLAWVDLDHATLKDSLRSYTTAVLRAMEGQGTLPNMVQIGNQVNHGPLWPEGHISNLDHLAGLLEAGVEGTEAVDPDMPVMMHIALGGQNNEARFWLDNMIARGVKFDIIGISYYPRWHGTLEDLYSSLHDLAATTSRSTSWSTPISSGRFTISCSTFPTIWARERLSGSRSGSGAACSIGRAMSPTSSTSVMG
jgi:arabinogalactan endo-1,4-beta-galactosidase